MGQAAIRIYLVGTTLPLAACWRGFILIWTSSVLGDSWCALKVLDLATPNGKARDGCSVLMLPSDQSPQDGQKAGTCSTRRDYYIWEMSSI